MVLPGKVGVSVRDAQTQTFLTTRGGWHSCIYLDEDDWGVWVEEPAAPQWVWVDGVLEQDSGHTHTHTHTFTHVCVCVCVCARMCVYVCVYSCMYVCMQYA